MRRRVGTGQTEIDFTGRRCACVGCTNRVHGVAPSHWKRGEGRYCGRECARKTWWRWKRALAWKAFRDGMAGLRARLRKVRVPEFVVPKWSSEFFGSRRVLGIAGPP